MSFSEHIVRSCSRLLNSTPMSVSPFFSHRPPGQPSPTNIYQYKKCKIYIILKVQVKLCVFTIFASGYTNVTITRSKMSPENVSQPSGQPSHCEPHPWLRFQNHTKGCATLIVRVKVHMDQIDSKLSTFKCILVIAGNPFSQTLPRINLEKLSHRY